MTIGWERQEFMSTSSHDTDEAFGFTIPGRHARGRLVRLGPVLDELLGKHG